MVPTGLTFDEYVDLKVRPRAGADRAFHEAADMEREAMFPMNLAGASSHLRSRGYDCRPEMLEVLIRNKVVAPAGSEAWSQADVEAAGDAEELAPVGLGEPAISLGQFRRDRKSPLVERVGEEGVAARGPFGQGGDSVSQVNGLLVDLEILEHEGHSPPRRLEQENRRAGERR